MTTVADEWIRTEADEKAIANGCWFDQDAAERRIKRHLDSIVQYLHP